MIASCFSTSAFAGQNWLCEGDTKETDIVKVTFETVSNTSIKSVLITHNEVVIARVNAQTSRDQSINPKTNNSRNRFNLSAKALKFELDLPVNLKDMDDEYHASLKIKNVALMNSSQ